MGRWGIYPPNNHRISAWNCLQLRWPILVHLQRPAHVEWRNHEKSRIPGSHGVFHMVFIGGNNHHISFLVTDLKEDSQGDIWCLTSFAFICQCQVAFDVNPNPSFFWQGCKQPRHCRNAAENAEGFLLRSHGRKFLSKFQVSLETFNNWLNSQNLSQQI